MNGSRAQGLRTLPFLGSARRAAAIVVNIGMLFCAACLAGNAASERGNAQIPPGAKVDQFFIVDCLLPGQIRQLGREVTYVSRREAIKTSARDCEIRGGEYVAFDRANYATALKVWLPLAEQGDPTAQTYVGEIFEKGLGVAPDYKRAAEWYRRAAEKGYSQAAVDLGSLYERGLGVPRDQTQALNWYRRAAGTSKLNFEIASGKPPPATGASKKIVIAPRRDGKVGFLLTKRVDSLGNYHALIIGNNDYQRLRRLETPVNDAREIGRILREQYGFKITLLLNANHHDTVATLDNLREQLTDEDNLLIYYAGHGYLDKNNQRGHWQPVDAELNSQANWISNVTVTDILNAMTVRQLLVVADSCYSGTLTQSAVGRLDPALSNEETLKLIQEMTRKRSRMVMTSGGIEPVLDNPGGQHSAFAQVFIELLQANVGVLAGQEMFGFLQGRVTAAAERANARQVPEYAPLKFARHASGDFFFVRTTS